MNSQESVTTPRDMPSPRAGTLAPAEPMDLRELYYRRPGAVIHDAPNTPSNTPNSLDDAEDTSPVDNPQIFKRKASKKRRLEPTDGLPDIQLIQQAEATSTSLSGEISTTARDGSFGVLPAQGMTGSGSCPSDNRMARSLPSQPTSNLLPMDTADLLDGPRGGTYGGIPCASRAAQQTLPAKRRASASPPQELACPKKDGGFPNHTSAPTADARLYRQIREPSCFEEPAHLSTVVMSSRDSSPLSSCPPSEQLDMEGETLGEPTEKSLVETSSSNCRAVHRQGKRARRGRQSETGVTLSSRDLTTEVWEDRSNLQRRSSRPKKLPSRFPHESTQVRSLHKISKKVNTSSCLAAVPNVVPSERTGRWLDQLEAKPEEWRLSQDANPISQSTPPKRAKSEASEKVNAATMCEDHEQQRAPRESGIEEKLGGAVDVIALPLDEKTLSAAIKAKEDGLLAAVYDVHSIRKIGERWFVRKKCDACIHSHSTTCNRASPCSNCEKKGLICDEKLWVTAHRARPKPHLKSTARGHHTPPAKVPPAKVRKVVLKASDSKETTIEEDDRPYPRGLPEVWSAVGIDPDDNIIVYGYQIVDFMQGRQALCETLVYYRAYQSGAYTHDDLSFGFLVDKQCGERDHMDDEIVITRAGGGLKRNLETGEMEQVADHSLKSKTVENFLNNKRSFCPVALIVGKGNPKCPTKIPYSYCVLGWFKVTHVWCEKIDGMKCFKFRFEKLDLELPSWWAPAGSPDPPRPYQYPEPAEEYTCSSCNEVSPKLYNEGWMCLTDSCRSFWKISGEDPPTKLHYNAAFLKQRTQWPSNVKAPYNLKPAMLAEDRGNDASYSVSHACWKGFSCPKCGRCNSREDWNGWECQTVECDYKYNVKRLILSPQALSNPHDPITDGHAISKDWISGPITEKVDFSENYRVHTYTIPDCGTITHFMANRTVNERADGPDDIFLALQQEDIGLKRFPLKISTLTGPMLAQHFAVNYGMPYKYVIDVDSRSFKDAPKVIHLARARLNWAGNRVIEDGSFKKFNELLTLGYFEKQKINYHDDGEEGLGPTIATLSLGGQATMTVRMKSIHYHGVSRTGAYVDKYPPTKGCINYEQRLLKHEEMKRSDSKMKSSLGKEIVKDLGLSRKRASPVWLSMRLNHGDIVLMHGTKIQTYYEHAVEPLDKLRYAMTCRYIDPGTVDSVHWWKANYDESQTKAYDGDETAKPRLPTKQQPTSTPLPPSLPLFIRPPFTTPLTSPPPSVPPLSFLDNGGSPADERAGFTQSFTGSKGSI